MVVLAIQSSHLGRLIHTFAGLEQRHKDLSTLQVVAWLGATVALVSGGVAMEPVPATEVAVVIEQVPCLVGALWCLDQRHCTVHVLLWTALFICTQLASLARKTTFRASAWLPPGLFRTLRLYWSGQNEPPGQQTLYPAPPVPQTTSFASQLPLVRRAQPYGEAAISSIRY